MLSALKKPDKNPFIAKKQAALAKSLTSWRKAAALCDANALAWYMRGAGRSKVARSVVDEIADHVVFAKNYNVWGPAADAICAAARFAREANDVAREAELIARVIEVPAYAIDSERDFLDGVIGRAKSQIDSAATTKRADAACSDAASALSTLVYFVETIRHGGFNYDRWYAVADLERAIGDGEAVLATRLAP